MKKLIYLLAAASIVLAACSSDTASTNEELNQETIEQKQETNKIPEYEISEERFDDAGIWYLTLSTSTRNKEDLETLVTHIKELAKKHEKKVESSFIRIYANDDSKDFLASGKFALSNKGLVQTGLEKTNEIEFEYKVPKGEENSGSKKVAAPQHDGPTADEVLAAFKNASLPVPNDRDNSRNCVDLECTKLITTDTVSIYEWPTTEKAKQVQDEYNFGTHQAGPIIIRMNDKNLDSAAYINELDKLVNAQN